MLKPRFAINAFAIPGCVIALAGVAVAVSAQLGYLAGDAMLWVGAPLVGLGTLFVVLPGRWGPLGDSKQLLRSGRRTQATILVREGTGASTGTGEHANATTTGRVYRIDLRLDDGGHEVRVYRYVNYRKAGAFFMLKELPVAYDPDDLRRIAIDWEQIPSVESYVAQLTAQAQAQAQAQVHAAQALMQQQVARAHLAPPRPSQLQGAHQAQMSGQAAQLDQCKVLNVEQVAVGSNGEPVLQLVVELPGAAYARGTVAGPLRRTVQPGEMVRVQLDPSRTAVVRVDW